MAKGYSLFAPVMPYCFQPPYHTYLFMPLGLCTCFVLCFQTLPLHFSAL